MIFITKITLKKDYIPFINGEELEFKQINMLVGDQGVGKSTLLHLLHNCKSKTIMANKIEELKKGNLGKRSIATVESNTKYNPLFAQDKGTNVFDEYADVIDIEHSSGYDGNMRFFDTEAHNPRIKYSEYESKRPLLQELSVICREIHKAVQNDRDKKHVREIFKEYADKAEVQRKDIDGFIINSHKSHGETILPMLAELAKIKNCVILLDEPETSLSLKSQFKLAEIINNIKNNNNQLFVATHSHILINSQNEVLSLEHKKWMKSDDFILTQQP